MTQHRASGNVDIMKRSVEKREKPYMKGILVHLWEICLERRIFAHSIHGAVWEALWQAAMKKMYFNGYGITEIYILLAYSLFQPETT